MTHRKKLIEVALPLDAINAEGSRRKRKAPGGYPTTLHKWWAQRPLAAARAVIFAQMVDDPSSHPELFPTEEAQEAERQRLFGIIEELVKWENTTNEAVLEQARKEIRKSWHRTCEANRDHPNAAELFDPDQLPAFHDPFAGAGSLPLEAQRLGLEAYASDLNPVAVLINKAMIEIPPKFAGRPPVNPEAQKDRLLIAREWRGAQGLAEDVHYYGKWMGNEAEKRIGHLYPPVEITAEMAKGRPDLKPYVGRKLTIIAWLWARTVKSPNPAFAQVDVPLASTFMLSTKAGKQAYVEPVIEGDSYRFIVKVGKPKNTETTKKGTKLGRGADFRCILSGTPISGDYIKAEGQAGRMGVRLMAVVAEGDKGRIYLSPSIEMEAVAQHAEPSWTPDVEFVQQALGFRVGNYGLTKWSDLFSPRQLVFLTTISNLLQEVRDRVRHDALASYPSDDKREHKTQGTDPSAYANAVTVYLAFALSRAADYGSSLATWRPKDNAMRSGFAMQTVQMTWDYAEGSPMGGSSSGFIECVEVVKKVLIAALGNTATGRAIQADAATGDIQDLKHPIVSTDPPYYDNVGYADLSDFFYVWLRRSLKYTLPELFATVTAPKAEELVAAPHRHGGSEKAEAFFLRGMTKVVHRLAERSHPFFPVTIYYAFKQSESTDGGNSTTSTGWETFLDAVVSSGFAISGTWPVRTEGDNRQRGVESNALASSIVLVCRQRQENAPTATRREFLASLKSELPDALKHLQRGNIAPVDLAQAAIGPGMAVYTRYAKVLDSSGTALSVRDALALINETLDEVLAEQEGDFDADTRWALAWFADHGFEEGPFGDAHTYFLRYNTAENGLVSAGIIKAGRGKVRLLKPNELPNDWDPATDPRLTVWEIVHHFVRVLEAGGEAAAARLMAKIGGKAEVARELAYRLYTLCERKKRAQEALSYNALVQSWPEIARVSRETVRPQASPQQTQLFDQE